MKYETRMYCITLRSLSAMQKGIQSAHAVVEYHSKYGSDADYKHWAKIDKTLIILECGTTDRLNTIFKQLKKHNIKCSSFVEPDLNNTTTAICFLADERAYAKNIEVNTAHSLVIRNIISTLELAK